LQLCALDVIISRWGCCFGFDHVGIGVNTANTVGFYPVGEGRMFDNGVVLPDLERFGEWGNVKDVIIIGTIGEQDRQIQEFIDRRRRDPKNYNSLSGRHCGGFVQDALLAAGITPFPKVANPGSFFNALKALNDAGVDFKWGVP
jgi:hypothetical protein